MVSTLLGILFPFERGHVSFSFKNVTLLADGFRVN